MNPIQTELMFEKWKIEFDNLENELDSFRAYFDHNRKCPCYIDECKHFKNSRHKVFGDRIQNLFDLCMKIGFQTHLEMNNSISVN